MRNDHGFKSKIPQMRAVVSPMVKPRVPTRSNGTSHRPKEGNRPTPQSNSVMQSPRKRRLWHSTSSASNSPDGTHPNTQSVDKCAQNFAPSAFQSRDMLQVAKDILREPESQIESPDELGFRREQAIFWLLKASELGEEEARAMLADILANAQTIPELPQRIAGQIQAHLSTRPEDLALQVQCSRLFSLLAKRNGGHFVSWEHLYMALDRGHSRDDLLPAVFQAHDLHSPTSAHLPIREQISERDLSRAYQEIVLTGLPPTLDQPILSSNLGGGGNFHSALRIWAENDGPFSVGIMGITLYVVARARWIEYQTLDEQWTDELRQYSTVLVVFLLFHSAVSMTLRQRRLLKWVALLQRVSNVPIRLTMGTLHLTTWMLGMSLSALLLVQNLNEQSLGYHALHPWAGISLLVAVNWILAWASSTWTFALCHLCMPLMAAASKQVDLKENIGIVSSSWTSIAHEGWNELVSELPMDFHSSLYWLPIPLMSIGLIFWNGPLGAGVVQALSWIFILSQGFTDTSSRMSMDPNHLLNFGVIVMLILTCRVLRCSNAGRNSHLPLLGANLIFLLTSTSLECIRPSTILEWPVVRRQCPNAQLSETISPLEQAHCLEQYSGQWVQDLEVRVQDVHVRVHSSLGFFQPWHTLCQFKAQTNFPTDDVASNFYFSQNLEEEHSSIEIHLHSHLTHEYCSKIAPQSRLKVGGRLKWTHYAHPVILAHTVELTMK